MPKSNTLPLAVAGVGTAGILIEYKNFKSGTYGGVVPKSDSQIAPRLIALTLLIVVLTFTIDQAPEFGNPLALLILVAMLIRYSSDFNLYFNKSQTKG